VSKTVFQPLAIPNADVRFAATWLLPDDADGVFNALMTQVAWETHRIRMFGREVDSPRRSCWIGDAGTSYVYSRARFEPRPWPPALQALRARIDAACGATFNSVLANLYRDGGDSMGWHSDDEPELGPAPVIASLSLGVTRRFVFRRRGDPAQKVALDLPHGSLLLMAGATQKHWKHALPRTAKPVGPRINLTFRRIGAG
jgi:alkylated DNA repair dioxygenase AlkB